MQEAHARRAVAAAISTASALDFAVDDVIVLSDSNRLVVRLMPCDVVARVTPMTHHASAEREVELVRRLAETDSPVATLDTRAEARVIVRDDFKISFWTSFDAVQPRLLPPADYAQSLMRLHAGLRRVEVTTPHFMDRLRATRRDAVSRDVTPDLVASDRAFLASALRDLGQSIVERRAPEQLLHGEPHPWNVLDTDIGPLFIDFEDTTRGPVEYDLGWVPTAVSDCSPNADRDLVDLCRGAVLAIVATHRWRFDDEHPSGRQSGLAFLGALRAGPPWPALDDVTW